MSIFYSYSNHRESSLNTYLKVSKELSNLIIDVDNNDKQNSSQLLNKITNHIDSASVFICDITPDTTNESFEYPSPNVMLELGYALKHFSDSNIILLLNTDVSNKVPSMLQGFYILEYNKLDDNDDDYYLDIVNKIEETINNIGTNKDWITFDYQLNDKFIELISILSKIQIKSYLIRYNKKLIKSVILFYYSNNKFIKLNIQNKTLNIQHKIIDLIDFDNLYNELKHLELLIYLKN